MIFGLLPSRVFHNWPTGERIAGPVESRQLLMARKESWARSSSLREAYSPFPSSQIFSLFSVYSIISSIVPIRLCFRKSNRSQFIQQCPLGTFCIGFCQHRFTFLAFCSVLHFTMAHSSFQTGKKKALSHHYITYAPAFISFHLYLIHSYGKCHPITVLSPAFQPFRISLCTLSFLSFQFFSFFSFFLK